MQRRKQISLKSQYNLGISSTITKVGGGYIYLFIFLLLLSFLSLHNYFYFYIYFKCGVSNLILIYI